MKMAPAFSAPALQERGKKVLITRPMQDALGQAEALQKHGLAPVISPVLSIEPCKKLHFEEMAAFAPEGVIVTSLNALRFMPERLLKLLKSVPLFTAGVASAGQAKKLGFDKVYLPKGRGSRGVIKKLREALPARQDKRARLRLLYLTGAPHGKELEEALKGDYAVMACEIYRAVLAPSLNGAAAAALQSHEFVAVTLFSSRSAQHTARLIRKALGAKAGASCLGCLLAFCLSPAVAKAALSCGFGKAIEAEFETEDSLIKKIVEQLT